MKALIHRLLLLRAERAASTSEYAAIFAVLVITVVVCVNIVGDRVRATTHRMDTQLARDAGLNKLVLGQRLGDAQSESPPVSITRVTGETVGVDPSVKSAVMAVGQGQERSE